MEQERKTKKAETIEDDLLVENNCNQIKRDANSSSSDDETNIQEELKEVAALRAAHQNHVMKIEDKMQVEMQRKMSLGEEAVFALNKASVREKTSVKDELSNVARLNVYRINSKFARMKNSERFDWKNGKQADKLQNVEEKAPNLSTHAYPFSKETAFDAKTNTQQVKDVLGRVKDREEHERILDVKEKLHQQFLQPAIEENPRKRMGDRHDGVLKISDRTLCGNGCEALLRVIKNNDKLKELDLSGCNIYRGDDLAQIIRAATSLKRLSLEWNSLGLARTGIAALASAIASNRSLKEVDLRSNRIGPSTVAALAHALQCNFSLACLDLRWNEIGPSGATTLVTMLQKNHSLIDVRLAGNGIPPFMQKQIDELLEKNRVSKAMTPSTLHEDTKLEFHGDIPKANTATEMDEVNLERIKSFQDKMSVMHREMDACKAEICELHLQKVASNTQLETLKVELKEEHLLRKFVEKEVTELQLQLHMSNKRVLELEEAILGNEKVATTKLSNLNTELMNAKEREQEARAIEAKTSVESKLLKDHVQRLQTGNIDRIQAIEERAKSDKIYDASIIQRLQDDLKQQNQKHVEEIDVIQSKWIAQLKTLEHAKEDAIQDCDKHKFVVLQMEAKMVMRDQTHQEEKDALVKIHEAQIATLKAEIATLQSRCETTNRDHQKTKKFFLECSEDYEKQIAQLKANITKIELAKTSVEEQMLVMTIEQGKTQERMRNANQKAKELESNMEAERLKHSQALAHELTKHLEDRKQLENDVTTTRRQIDIAQLRVKQVQSEQEQRKFDTEKRVMGTETAVLEWVHQQFATLKSSLTMQHSVAGIG